MKCSKALVLILVFSCFAIVSCVTHGNIVKSFDKFIEKYERNYVKGSTEYQKRFLIFKESLALHKTLNANRTSPASAVYGITKFSDLSHNEFKARYLSSLSPETHVSHHPHHHSLTMTSPHKLKLPAKVDWREKGIVTAIKNQESCGGCWAYSVVEAVESMYAKTSGDLVPLSVQEVLDCSYGVGSLYSCQGGDTCSALKWMLQTNIAINRASDYPTTNKNKQPCKMTSQEGAHVLNYTCDNFVGREGLLLGELAAVGPVSVSVDASMWANYQGGIIQHHCGEMANNHAVDIVGYDTTGPIPFYIAKNSWGENFGNDGYVYLEAYKNMCGAAERVSTVTVSKSLRG